MQTAFTACLLAAAVNAAATKVTTDEYKYSKANPMGTTTTSSTPAGFGEAFKQMDYNVSLAQMDDNTVIITKTIELTMVDTFQPGTDKNSGEVYVCDKEGTNYECVVGTWDKTKLTLGKYQLAGKPTSNAKGQVTSGGLTPTTIDQFFPTSAGSADCASIQEFTWADSKAGTAVTSPATCAYWTTKDITWTTPSFKFTFTRTVSGLADTAAAAKVLTDYATTAKEINSGISYTSDADRERLQFDEPAVLVVAKAPVAIAGADVVTSAMVAIGLTAAAALF